MNPVAFNLAGYQTVNRSKSSSLTSSVASKLLFAGGSSGALPQNQIDALENSCRIPGRSEPLTGYQFLQMLKEAEGDGPNPVLMALAVNSVCPKIHEILGLKDAKAVNGNRGLVDLLHALEDAKLLDVFEKPGIAAFMTQHFSCHLTSQGVAALAAYQP